MVEVPSSNLGSPTNLKAFKINDLQRFLRVSKSPKNSNFPRCAQIVPTLRPSLFSNFFQKAVFEYYPTPFYAQNTYVWAQEKNIRFHDFFVK
jgi:hypothetical protein